jgi:hypothetical protein
MEDPIPFSVWVLPREDKSREAQTMLHAAQPIMPQLAVMKTVVQAIAGGTPFLLAVDVGWKDAQEWTRLAASIGTPTLFQAGYGPADSGSLATCPIHEFQFAGCLGCPVCEGRHRG